MDPLPIDQRRKSCMEILSKTRTLVTVFKNAASLDRNSAPAFETLATLCDKLVEVVDAILSWIGGGPRRVLLDAEPWNHLTTTLSRAGNIIASLQDAVVPLMRQWWELRSRPRSDTTWTLDSLQSLEEDVYGVTDALHQTLQYMQVLSGADMTPKAQADYRDAAERTGQPRAVLALMTSMAGGSQADDTENTLDPLAPPYALTDVRTTETHLRWHVAQSVTGVTTRSVTGLTTQSVTGLTTGQSRQASEYGDIEVVHDGEFPDIRNPLALKYLTNAHRFHQNEEDPPPRPETAAKYGYQIDSLEIIFDNRWLPTIIGLQVTERPHLRKDLPEPTRTLVEDMKVAIKLGHPLLRFLRAHLVSSVSREVLQAYLMIRTLWHLCVTSGSKLCDGYLDTSQPDKFESRYFGEVPEVMRKLAKEARNRGLYIEPNATIDSVVEVRAEIALSFANYIMAEHGSDLERLAQNMIFLDLELGARRLDT